MSEIKKLEIITRKPEGPCKGAVVFLHGACHGAWCWENYLNYFPQHGYEACAFSLPGHGKSWGCGPSDKVSFQNELDAVKTVLKPYHGEVVLVGHSLGGTIAQKVLTDEPELARGCVLIATGMPMWLQKGFKGLREMMAVMSAPEFKSVSRAMSREVPPDGETLRQSGFFRGRISVEEAERLRGQMVVEKAGFPAKLKIDGTKMRGPVMVLASDYDVCSTLAMQEKVAASYGTTPVILHGLCHNMMLDPEWETSARAVLDFVEEIYTGNPAGEKEPGGVLE